MQIIKDYPPNYHTIKSFLPFDDKTQQPVFCYGETIYSPFSGDLPPDLILHESIHADQQRTFQNPDFWWNRYCIDKEFRLSQEVEAYAYQYNFIKRHIPKAAHEALEDFSLTMASPLYDLNINRFQASSLIRHYAKKLLR